MFKLKWMDWVRGLVVAVFTGAWISVMGLFGYDFNVFTADWHAIGELAVNGGFLALAGYISKNLITADNGKILGVL